MATIPIYQVDAFADSVFRGNPAAVCFLDTWLDASVMQDIAAENNLSETAFVIPSDDEVADYDLRWFTPTEEVRLCGHATLATASVILNQRDPGRSKVTFSTLSGNLTVNRKDNGYEIDLPSLPPVNAPTPDELSDIVNGAPVLFLRERDDGGKNLAILETAEQVRSAAPDMQLTMRLPGDGLIISAPGDAVDNCDFVSRYFAPNGGIPEDPVTGSAHSVLVPYWSERLGKLIMSARQVSHRGGSLSCRLNGGRVVLGGNAVLFLEGTISI